MIMYILLSVCFNAIIAGMFALVAYFISPDAWIPTFWIVNGLLWLIAEPLNRYLNYKKQKSAEETIKAYNESIDITKTGLECEYCQKLNLVEINLNKQNSFKCDSCRNYNMVIIQFTTVRATAEDITNFGDLSDVSYVDEYKQLEEDV